MFRGFKKGRESVLNREPIFVEFVDERWHLAAKSEKRRAVEPE
jgi:hypothetical protein